MCDERMILDQVGLIYDAAGDPTLWPVFLERLRQIMGTMATTIFVDEVPPRAGQGEICVGSIGLDPARYRSYADHYRFQNVALIHGAHLLLTGRVYDSEELCPREVLVRTEFYNDWIAPQEMGYAAYGVIQRDRSTVGLVNAVRSERAGPFPEKDLRFLGALLPHLRRAIQLHLTLARLTIQERTASETLDWIPVGLIVLDGHGRMVHANRSGERILAQKDGLTAEPGGLRAATVSETRALGKAVHDAISVSFGRALNPGETLTLSRPSGKRPFAALVIPLHSIPDVFPEAAAAAMFVTDPESEDEPCVAILGRLYGLSRAEAAVAALLAQGKSLRETCDRLHVSLNTARTHLKCIFDKTETRRQAELVRLLLRSPASLRWPEATIPSRAAEKRASMNKNHPFG